MIDKATLIRHEILNLSYWEHFKASQDAHRALGAEHQKSIQLQDTANSILKQLKDEGKS